MISILDIISEAETLFAEYPEKEDLYSTFYIPKKRGFRKISSPFKRLKKIQKNLYKYFIYNYKSFIDSNSHGFIKNRSIITNSASHFGTLTNIDANIDLRNHSTKLTIFKINKEFDPNKKFFYGNSDDTRSVLVKMDIKKAFDSVNKNKIDSFFLIFIERIISQNKDKALHNYLLSLSEQERENWKKRAKKVLFEIASFHECLPQGAPTSPFILNSCLADFHNKLNRLIHDKIASYVDYYDQYIIPKVTNYADDISISFLFTKTSNARINLSKLNKLVELELKEFDFSLNHKKTKLFSKKQGFRITGVTVTEGGLTIKRKKYNLLRARLNNYIKDAFCLGNIPESLVKEFERIVGLFSHLNSLSNKKALKLSDYFLRRIKKYNTLKRISGHYTKKDAELYDSLIKNSKTLLNITQKICKTL